MALFSLREELVKEHSKAQCNKIVAWVGSDQKRFDELFTHFSGKELKLVKMAAWPMSYCVQEHPALIKKHFTDIINILSKEKLIDAVKRNSLRALQCVDIPEKYEGQLMDLCFKYAAAPEEPIAVRVFALNVLSNLVKKYPEILPEIKLLIEENENHQTAAFKSVANKIKRTYFKNKK
ncbi:hypothetical protein ACQ33O_09265 [Ferruginibacter sp. SUN002]|uniref:hypothetical protein n=1 Tax=Ferruginibacter sp. SUN002 TaxID=2937789 RepID=UPI003D35FFD0